LNSGKLDESSERALVERCQKNDFEAFGKLVDAYQNRVFGFIRRMVPTPDDAADLTQEVFVRAFQNFYRFDSRCSVRTWLFRIAYNLCIDRARRASHIPQQVDFHSGEDEEAMEVPDSRWEPQQAALDSELATALEGGILGMSEKLRSVLILHDKEDLSYEEIAETLGVPIGTVKSRLFLARAHLQNVIKNYLQGEVNA
jgi:RNA polymerase sigma-70 factor, ECF subfamily